jgi:glycerol-1-phosphatase
VTADDGAFGCGGWAARLQARSGRLDLAGGGDPIDGLRALCAAAWAAWPDDARPSPPARPAAPPRPVTAEMAQSAVAKLGFPASPRRS